MAIDWMNPTEDVIEAKRVGYEEGVREQVERAEDAESEAATLAGQVLELRAELDGAKREAAVSQNGMRHFLSGATHQIDELQSQCREWKHRTRTWFLLARASQAEAKAEHAIADTMRQLVRRAIPFLERYCDRAFEAADQEQTEAEIDAAYDGTDAMSLLDSIAIACRPSSPGKEQPSCQRKS